MQTTITARHCEINDALRERARTVVERLGRARASPHRVRRRVRHRRRHADGGAAPPHRRAASCWWRSGEADDHRTALDRAEEKLRRQLDKDPAHPKARRSRDSLPKIG